MSTAAERLKTESPVGYAGVNHIALVTNDMEKTVRFYRDVLGMKLVGTTGGEEEYPYRHYFLSTSGGPALAFFEWPEAEMPPPKGSGVPASGRVFDHIAIAVSSEDDLHAVRARLQAAGWPVGEVADHFGARSIYFEDPNNISLEMCYWPRDLDRDPLFVDRDPIPAAREITLS